MRRILTVTVMTLGLAILPGMAHAGDRTGGWTGSGTITGKGHSDPYQTFYRVGSSYVPTVMPECWRLDLRKYGLNGRRCVSQATWDRAEVGDEIRPDGTLISG